jgi:predicted DsbA family dithiol-disulfide isomerase
MNSIRIDVFGDIACPFCYIGEKRLDRALELHPEFRVTRVWRPFQLQPTLPKTGVPWREFAVQKFGGLDQMRAAFAQVVRVAEGEQIAFNLDEIYSAANTADAHRLILAARAHGQEWPVIHALFAAYFIHGRNLNDRATLLEIASSTDLDSREVDGVLSSETFKQEVHDSQLEAEQIGVRGVPFYIFDGRYALSGAQTIEAFVRALELSSSRLENTV